MDDKDSQTIVCDILLSLAKGQDVLKDNLDNYANRLVDVYSDGNFRHMYSGIYAVITAVDSNEDCDLETLSQNIARLYKEIQEKHSEKKNVCKGVQKLYDHTNLDIARINYLKEKSERVKSELDEMRHSVEEEASQLREKAQKMQREYVAILGVFSAIVVSFVSGLGFSSSVLANMHTVSSYRLVFVVMMLAIVLFDVLAVLMNFVRDMVFTGEKHKYLFIGVNIGVNIVFLAILIGDFIAWHYGMRIFPCQ